MHRRNPGRSGFTLIELTVVVLLIMILMGFVFTAGQGMFDRARKTQVKNDLTQIVTAVNAYYTEYGKYPMADIKQGFDTLYGDPNGSNGNEDVFNVLRAVASGVNAGDVLNPRKIIFFNANLPKNAANPRSGVAGQDTTGTNGSPIKTGALVRSLGRYLFGVYRWKL
jgi:type II secretory pathway pseudopilin PulG